jgi:hypothetical protein
MRYQIYYHLVSNKKDDKFTEVLHVIELADEKICTESSKKFRQKVLEDLRAKGWSSKVNLTTTSKISVTAMKSDA